MWLCLGADVAGSPNRRGRVLRQMWRGPGPDVAWRKRRVQIAPAQGAWCAVGLLLQHCVDGVKERHHGVVRRRRKREVSAAKKGGVREGAQIADHRVSGTHTGNMGPTFRVAGAIQHGRKESSRTVSTRGRKGDQCGRLPWAVPNPTLTRVPDPSGSIWSELG
jgi:hypothetical protein